jgi:hypothetical protein
MTVLLIQRQYMHHIESREESPVLVTPQVHDVSLKMRVQGLQVLESEFVEGNALLLSKFHSSAYK